MKPLPKIVSIIVLATSILVAEESIPRSGADGDSKGEGSNNAPVPRYVPPRLVPSSTPKQLKFEYKVYLLPQSNSEQEKELNKLGREGWELVLIETQVNDKEARGRSYSAYLKRILREPTPDVKQ